MYIFSITNIFQFVSKSDLDGLNRSIQILNFQFHECFLRLFVTGKIDSLLGWVLGWLWRASASPSNHSALRHPGRTHPSNTCRASPSAKNVGYIQLCV